MSPRASCPMLLGGLLLASAARAQTPGPPPGDAPAPPRAWLPPAYPTYPEQPPPYYPYPPPRLEGIEPRDPSDRGFSVKLSAGAAYQRVFDSSLPGPELGVYVGGVRPTMAWYGGVDALVVRMEGSLWSFAIRPGATWEGRLGRVRLGVGLSFAVLGVERATTGSFMIGFGLGPNAFGTVDLVRGEAGALFLGLKMRAEILAGADANGAPPLLWGPSVMVGWRSR